MEYDGYWISPRGGIFELKDSEFSRFPRNRFESNLATNYHFAFILKYPTAFGLSMEEVNTAIEKHKLMVTARKELYEPKISKKRYNELKEKYKDVDMDYEIADDMVIRVCRKGWIRVRNNSHAGYMAVSYNWTDKTLDALSSFVQYAIQNSLLKKNNTIRIIDIKTGISGDVPAKLAISYDSIDDFFEKLNESKKWSSLKKIMNEIKKAQ